MNEIHFIPNDPLVRRFMPGRNIIPHPARPAELAQFGFILGFSAGVFSRDTRDFVFWQVREACLRGVAAWETLDEPLRRWARRGPLTVVPVAGAGDCPWYQRSPLRVCFPEHTERNGRITYSGASTDMVAHEVGHALLDAVRPDLWECTFREVGAVHEGFGDVLAILTALTDREIRIELLRQGLNRRNFVESIGEDLAALIRRRFGSSDPQSKPRHALNRFRYRVPGTSRGSNDITSGPHSFGQLLSGCFYDLVLVFYGSHTNGDESALEGAARTAGKLLISGLRTARLHHRFFRELGRSMAQQASASPTAVAAIEKVFGDRGLDLDLSTTDVPVAELPGRPPRPEFQRVLTNSSLRKLRNLLDLPSRARLSVTASAQDRNLAYVATRREVPVGHLAAELKDVSVIASEQVVVGEHDGTAAVLGEQPDPEGIKREVEIFVSDLLRNEQIRFGRGHRSGRETHALRKHGTTLRLTRIRFNSSVV